MNSQLSPSVTRPSDDPKIQRLRIKIQGVTQGVGYRPFIFQWAQQLQLTGWVQNTSSGVALEVEGPKAVLDQLLMILTHQTPPLAQIQSLEPTFLKPIGFSDFQIKESLSDPIKRVLILPDIATCSDCLNEMMNPADRRYQYPFINCTHCGPRLSILQALPYDRPNTSMASFQLCDACSQEYHDPNNRRFHAQPIACSHCGPQLVWKNSQGVVLVQGPRAFQAALVALQAGSCVALKGIGGFQILVDARREDAVQRLRQKKNREAKPFAVLFPSLTMIQQYCHVAPLEQRLLQSPESPIVLLHKNHHAKSLAPSVAPDNPMLGSFLPYSPLHHLIMHELDFPVIATSGNRSEEPICVEDDLAQASLGDIVDFFLTHDRPIVRPVDDSVVRVLLGHEQVLRRARGYAPLPITLPQELPPLLAVGGHLKNTIAISVGPHIILSQHLGDLDHWTSQTHFQKTIQDFLHLYDLKPQYVVHDLHPDYASSLYAQSLDIPTLAIQHHYAHALACAAENDVEVPFLAIVWDGSGYGTDGTLWGGEFLEVTPQSYRRRASFRTFQLPGGEKAIRNPARIALSLFEAMGIDWKSNPPEFIASWTESQRHLLAQMMHSGFNSPWTSSVGRLFDAVAALMQLSETSQFEGQTAMKLEFLLTSTAPNQKNFPFRLISSDPIRIDWEPLIRDLWTNYRQKQDPALLAARFHNTLIEAAVAVTQQLGYERVVLSGGCFQNRYLTEHLVDRLKQEHFEPFIHQRIPPNDGGLSLGQILGASRMLSIEHHSS